MKHLPPDVARKYANETISGAWKFVNATTGLSLESTSPRFLFNDTNAASNAKLWELAANGNDFTIKTKTDADGVGKQIFLARRAGTALSQMTFGTSGGVFPYFDLQAGFITYGTDTGDLFVSAVSGGTTEFNVSSVDSGEVLDFGCTSSSTLLSTLFSGAPASIGTWFANVSGNPIVFSLDYATAHAILSPTYLALKNDSYQLRLGAGDDLLLYHDGTNSIIENQTGNLKILVNGEIDLEEVTTSTGANIPTIGTNKPGSAVSLTPSTWMTLIVNGTTYYMPLWI